MVELLSDPYRLKIYILENVQHLNPEAGTVHLSFRTPIWHPPTDVFETEAAVIVRCEIAGMVEADFSIQLDGRYLTVRGVRPDVAERRAYHQMEIMFGEFSVELELPCPVEAENAQAVYQNGFLRITMPKSLPKQITIE